MHFNIVDDERCLNLEQRGDMRVCVREREKKRQRGKERERKKLR